MRILHTSDWHLGAQLHEQSRIPEQTAFLEWLKALMRKEQPDALIIAGDIFDTCAPSNTAQNLYYDFLSATFKEGLCRNVVVVGGNHDSPSLLDAPGNVLAHLRTHVVGSVAYLEDGKGGYVPDYEKEVVVINDAAGNPALVIGAVPYLRDADLRTSEAMETDADRSDKLKRGFKEHYFKIADIAHQKGIGNDDAPLPMVLTGHLFLTGATMAEEKSERDLHIGNLGALDAALLPKADYYALGHLHTAQKVGGIETCRYSGAPIPLSFGEIRQTKSVSLVDFSPGTTPVVRVEPIPQTQKLSQLKGTPEDISAKLNELVATRESVWVDIQVTEGVGDLSTWWSTYSATVEGSGVRLLRWQNARGGKNGSALAAAISEDATLDNLTPEQLFKMRLTDEDLAVDDQAVFSAMFAEISQKFAEADTKKD
jgi:exonuclease SbcD